MTVCMCVCVWLTERDRVDIIRTSSM